MPATQTRAHDLVTAWLVSLDTGRRDSRERRDRRERRERRDRHHRSYSVPRASASASSTTVQRVTSTRSQSVPLMSMSDIAPLYVPASAASSTGSMLPPPEPIRGRTPSASANDTGSASRASSRNLVEQPLYRHYNLEGNHVLLLPQRQPLPDAVAELVGRLRGLAPRNSPEPSSQLLAQDTVLQDMLDYGASEAEVERYFSTAVFLPHGAGMRSDRLTVDAATVPCDPTATSGRIRKPAPNMLYGYNTTVALSAEHRECVRRRFSREAVYANSEALALPFLAVEFKGDGAASHGSMWVATNQCLGASAVCVHIAVRFFETEPHPQQQQPHAQTERSAAFSIAMNGTEARIFVAWKHDNVEFHMHLVDVFCFHYPDHFIRFRRMVHNILEWSHGPRLIQVRHFLDTMMQQEQQEQQQQQQHVAASQQAEVISLRRSSRKRRRTSSII